MRMFSDILENVIDNVRVSDVETEASVIENLYPESVEDGVLVVEKRSFRQRGTGLVKRAATPCVTDLAEGDVPLAVDQLNQPDVPPEIILSHCL